MTQETELALIGAGLIGQTHIAALARTPGVRLAAIVEPGPSGPATAAAAGVPWYPDCAALIAAGGAMGAIVATPNATHVPLSAQLLRAGIPVLLEKPVAESPGAARELIRVADATGVPVLVGHHRRHTQLVEAAHRLIHGGALGELVMASVTTALAKPPAYFDVPWRGAPGSGGPLLINLVHELDLLRYFFGEIHEVQAMISHRRRGRPVEDQAAVCLSFRQGGFATFSLSDAAVGPWAWDLTAGENPARFPAHPVSAHHYAGTRAGLSLPDLTLWSPSGPAPDWMQALRAERQMVPEGDPYTRQLQHFAGVIRGEAPPLVGLRDATANLLVLEAIRDAAASGQRREVDLSLLD